MRVTGAITWILAVAILAGCQPSVEQRLSSAREYTEAANYQAASLELKNALLSDPENSQARAMMAFASFQLADFSTASAEYTRALKLGADVESNWIGLGRSLLRTGDAEAALERVLPNLDSYHTSEAALTMKGEIFAALGNYNDARIAFQSAADIDAESERAIIGLAVVTAGQGDVLTAQKLLEDSTQLTTSTARSWQVLGNFVRAQGNLDRAVKVYQRAIESESPRTPLADRFDTRAALVSTAIDSKNLAVARTGLQALESIFPGHPTLNYLRGRIAFAEGDSDAAASELREYLADVPNDPRAHAVMGAISFSKDYYSQAEMYLQQAVRDQVGGESARRLLAETRLRLNKPQEALQLLGGANLDATSDPQLLGLIGRAEFSAGNRSSGLKHFEQGLAADPDNPQMNMLYAIALISEGDNEQAIEILERAADHEDAMHRREMLLIAAHQRNGDGDKAKRVAEALLVANPDDAAAYAVVGAFERGVGDVQESEGHFRDALRLDPENEIALMGIASFARDRGDEAAAEAALTGLLDAQPGFVPALTMLGQLLLPARRFDEFEQRLAAAVQSAPQSSAPRLLQVKLALASDDPENALKHLRKAREIFPNLPEIRYLEGITLIRMGQMESALISLSRAASAEPTNPRFQFDLAIARLQSRDYFGASTAINAYRSLASADPVGLSVQVSALIGLRDFTAARRAIDTFEVDEADVAFVGVLRGDIALAVGDADTAVQQFEFASKTLWDRGIALRLSSAYLAANSIDAPRPLERWLAEHPDDVAVRRSYGQMLQSVGNSTGAIAEYERVLEQNSDNAVALNNLAWEYSLEGRSEALGLARRAYELQPQNGSIADTYGWILFLGGRAEESVTLLRKARSLSPENDEILFRLAKVLSHIGERDEARQIVSTLLDSGRSFPSRPAALEFAKTL